MSWAMSNSYNSRMASIAPKMTPKEKREHLKKVALWVGL